MSAERINSEPSADNAAASREPVVPFRVPLASEAGIAAPAEKKSKRNRKKRKKELNAAVNQQAAGKEPVKNQAPRNKGILDLESGEFTLWQRPEGPQQHASAKVGEKVLNVAGKQVEAASKPDNETANAVQEWHQQPMVQHQAGERPPEPSENKVDKKESSAADQPKVEKLEERRQEAVAETAEQPVRLNPFEQSYEPPQPPLQPPDPMSYRRRFWSEQPATGPDADDALPPPHDYERLAQEPLYQPSVRTVEAPAAVPGVAANRYESPVPPGYQRTQADVNRAAWTGLLAGWWFGRRGKRKAVESARQAGVKEGLATATARSRQPAPERRRSNNESYPTPRLEAEPIHTYPTPETGRTVIQPLSVESRDRLRPPEQFTHDRLSSVEQLVVPLASVAVFDRAVNRAALERTEVPRSIKLAAAKAAEVVVERVPEVPVATVPRTEVRLGKRELMRLSKDIKVDGVPLKEIYKAKKIDETGLQAVVNTYLRGGDVRQQLAEEIVVKEQSYERDPVLRHQRLVGERKVNGRSGTAGRRSGVAGGVGQTLTSAWGSVASATESGARSAGRAIASGAKTAQRDIIDNSNTADWLSITAVVVLYSVILILLLT